MFSKLTCALALMFFTAAALADSLPRYYPAEGFQRTGRVDAIEIDNQRIVIGDIPYTLSSNVVVHALSAYSVPVTRVTIGAQVGWKASAGRQVIELWLLPDDYVPERRRGAAR